MAQLRDEVGKKAQEKGVQMVGLGLEMVGLESFQEGKFWTGDLIVENPQQEVHKFLNLKRASVLKMFDIGMLRKGAQMQKEYGGNATEGGRGDLVLPCPRARIRVVSGSRA